MRHDLGRLPPTVSVIVPVRNDASGLATLLPALLAQTYPRERTQVLVIDNGSTDDSLQVARWFAQEHPALVHVLVEPTPGSYAARNTGLRMASGDILAFTDADCTPDPDWLAAGVRALRDQAADLAGGRVAFRLPPQPSAAALYDAISNMRTWHTVRMIGVTATANLFATRRVVETIGFFPGHVRSGGDAIWTHRATRAGLTLAYAPNAMVSHPTRELGPLLARCRRVGSGQPAVWQELGYPWWRACLALLRGLLPRSARSLRTMAQERGIAFSGQQMLRVWWVSWACSLAGTWGRLGGLLHRSR